MHTLDIFLHSFFSFYIPVFVVYESSLLFFLLPEAAHATSFFSSLFTVLQAHRQTHTHTLMYRYTGTLLLEMGPNMFMSSRNIYNHYQPHLTHTHIRPDLLGYLKTSGHIRVLTFERPHALTYSVDVARDTLCVCVRGLNVFAINKTEISLFLRRENVAERST